jgi:hypothetical protein
MGIYNPVVKAFVFGGGNGYPNLYKLDADGKLSTLEPAPFPLPLDLFYFQEAALGVVFILRYDYGNPQVFLYKSQSTAPATLPGRALDFPKRGEVFYWDLLGRRFHPHLRAIQP